MLATALSHWQVWLVPAFTLSSISLTAVAAGFVALGKVAPPWISDALGFVGRVLHFLNGNVVAATAEAPQVTQNQGQ